MQENEEVRLRGEASHRGKTCGDNSGIAIDRPLKCIELLGVHPTQTDRARKSANFPTIFLILQFFVTIPKIIRYF
jgi:hypothetical protein